MTSGEYLAGVAYFALTLGPSLAAAVLVTRKRYGYLTGLPQLFAFAVWGAAAVLAADIIPATFGLLNRASPIVVAMLLLGGAWALPSAPATTAPDAVVKPPRSPLTSIVIATAGMSAVLVYELARLRLVVSQPFGDIDMLTFHLPGVARFIQTGTVWQVNQFLPGFATAQYPNNGDFLILATVLPWHDLAFARIPAVAFFALTGAAVYALGMELGATRAAAVTFAAVALVVPAFSRLALDGVPDDITVSLLTIGVLFLIRHLRTGRNGELLLAGLALGLSLGTKWFGLTDGVVVMLVWLAARLVARAPWLRIARDGALAVAAMAAGGGIWLIRNLVESGNPLYPKKIAVLGVQLFAGSHNDVIDRFGYTVAHYLGNFTVLRQYIYPAFKKQVGISGFVLIGGVGIAIVLDVVRARNRARTLRTAAVAGCAIAVLGFCVLYVITPGSAYGPAGLPVEAPVNVRWLTPGVAVAAAVCAGLTGYWGRWTVLLELGALAGIIDAIELGPTVGVGTAARAAFVVLVVGALIAILRSRLLRWRAIGARRGLAMIVVGLVVAVIAGRVDQRNFDRGFYAAYDPVLQWVGAHAPSGHRIGFTGGVGKYSLSAILPAFGPRLGNEVVYIGDVVRHSLEVPARKGSFRSELARGRYDLVLIQLQYAGSTDSWIRSFGYRPLVSSSALALYAAPRLRPPRASRP